MGTTGDTSRTRGAVSQLEGDRLTKYAQPQESFLTSRIFSQHFTRYQNGMVQITMTCDDCEMVSYAMTMKTLLVSQLRIKPIFGLCLPLCR